MLFTVYLHHRGEQPELFAESQATLNRALGATNTIVLLASSLSVVLAARALRSDLLRRYAPRLVLAAVALGLCFIGIKGVEYHAKFSAGITPNTNQFYMYYFVLTGLHLAHLVVGLGVLLGLLALARKKAPTKMHIVFFEAGACFWHMVDLLWIVIFPLIFLVR